MSQLAAPYPWRFQNTVPFRTNRLTLHRVLQALMSSLAAIVERPPPAARARSTTSTPPSLSRDNTGLSTSPPATTAATATHKKRPPPDALCLLTHRPGIDGAALGSPAAAPASPAASETDPAIANVFYGLKPLPEAVPAQRSPSRRGGSKSSRRVTARAAKTGSPTGSAAARPSTAGAGARAVGGGKSTLSRTGKELIYSGEIRGVGINKGEGGAGALRARILAAGR